MKNSVVCLLLVCMLVCGCEKKTIEPPALPKPAALKWAEAVTSETGDNFPTKPVIDNMVRGESSNTVTFENTIIYGNSDSGMAFDGGSVVYVSSGYGDGIALGAGDTVVFTSNSCTTETCATSDGLDMLHTTR